MTSSGTTTFDPTVADLTLEAFERCGIRPPALTTEHMISARMSANLELVQWSNRQVNLWKVGLHSDITLVDGTATYTLDTDVVSILDAYIRTTSNSVNTDRIILPMGRSDYAALVNKAAEGMPSQYWFERINAPQVTLWQVPGADQVAASGVLHAYVVRRVEDAAASMGQTMDVNYRFLEAFAAGLAKRLAVKWAPDRYEGLKEEAQMAWDEAAAEDREIVPTTILPDLSGYYRSA